MAESEKEPCLLLWMLYAVIAMVAFTGVAFFGWEALAPILVVGGALILVAIRYSKSDERLRKSQELELEPLVSQDSDEGKVLNRELAALAFCIDELESRAAEAGPHDWIWETKLRVARMIRQEWTDRIDWECDATLGSGEKETLLEDHPLLQSRHADATDPAERYAEEDWYKQIRSEVMQFVNKERARAL